MEHPCVYPAPRPAQPQPIVPLRAIAVSAPDWISGSKHQSALNSADPASLFNACRHAAGLAQRQIGSWAFSNWAVPRAQLRKNFLLMYSLDDMERLRALLLSERPNLLLLGAMTLCMPGAIACARLAKEILGDEVLIVLGGRHASETIYLVNERDRDPATVRHHHASPGRLIRTCKLSPVFDVILSGDGEHIVARLGQALCGLHPRRLASIADELNPETPGQWIADFPSLDRTIVSVGKRIDYDQMPSIARIFGVGASFGVFGGRMTAHIFSDTGRGCVYDCAFCSERQSVTGGIRDIKGAPRRLHRQLRESAMAIAADHPGKGASAFVEDSIFLSGSPTAIAQFCDLAEQDPIDIVFGGQFTIDQILRRRELIARLGRNGLRYVFVGLETFEPNEIGGMSKDIGGRADSWQARFALALEILLENNISCGCALLFGLGEAQPSRVALLKSLIEHRRTLGQPVTISANWAVQHPLGSNGANTVEDYLRWGTPDGELLEAFHRFGEASLEYPLAGVDPPVLSEVQGILALLDQFEAGNA